MALGIDPHDPDDLEVQNFRSQVSKNKSRASWAPWGWHPNSMVSVLGPWGWARALASTSLGKNMFQKQYPKRILIYNISLVADFGIFFKKDN